jgi:hypothetical protein
MYRQLRAWDETQRWNTFTDMGGRPGHSQIRAVGPAVDGIARAGEVAEQQLWLRAQQLYPKAHKGH